MTAQIEAVAGDLHDPTPRRSACSPTRRSSKRWRPRSPSWICRWSSSIRCWSRRAASALLDEDGVRALCAELLPRARVVTPNIPEAEALSGRRIESMRRCARGGAADSRHGRGRGDHHRRSRMRRAPGTDGERDVVDLLFDGHVFHELRAPRVDVAPHARDRLHVRVGGRRRSGARPARCRTPRRARSNTSPARSRTPRASATAADRSIISGSDGPAEAVVPDTRRSARRRRLGGLH